MQKLAISHTANLTADQQVMARLVVFRGKTIGPAKVTSNAGKAIAPATSSAAAKVTSGSAAPTLGVAAGAAVTSKQVDGCASDHSHETMLANTAHQQALMQHQLKLIHQELPAPVRQQGGGSASSVQQVGPKASLRGAAGALVQTQLKRAAADTLVRPEPKRAAAGTLVQPEHNDSDSGQASLRGAPQLDRAAADASEPLADESRAFGCFNDRRSSASEVLVRPIECDATTCRSCALASRWTTLGDHERETEENRMAGLLAKYYNEDDDTSTSPTALPQAFQEIIDRLARSMAEFNCDAFRRVNKDCSPSVDEMCCIMIRSQVATVVGGTDWPLTSIFDHQSRRGHVKGQPGVSFYKTPAARILFRALGWTVTTMRFLQSFLCASAFCGVSSTGGEFLLCRLLELLTSVFLT